MKAAVHTRYGPPDVLALDGFSAVLANFYQEAQIAQRWQQFQLSDVSAKMIIYRAFVEAELEAPRHLDRKVHDLYFAPQFEDFRPRTMWSLSNAFTSAFKELEPVPQFRATAKLGEYLDTRFSRNF